MVLLCVWCKAAGSQAQAVAAEGRIRLKTRASRGGVEGGHPAASLPGVRPGGAVRTGESWRDKAAERLGLVRSEDGPRPGAGRPESKGTTIAAAANEKGARAGARTGRTDVIPPSSTCNVTMACHVCPEAAMRDNADYCLQTGWRHQVRCVNGEGAEFEVRFESCECAILSNACLMCSSSFVCRIISVQTVPRLYA